MKTLLFKIVAYLFLILSCSKEELKVPSFDTSLQFKWAKALKGPSNEDEIDAVATDKDGNVYVSGKFEDELVIDGQSKPITSAGKADIMIVKYDSNGVWKWTKHFGGVGEDNIFDADCDKDGNIILSGYFQGVVTFDNYELVSKGGFDMLIIKINPEGEVLWAKNYGGIGNDGGNEIVISTENKIIVGAQSDGTFQGISNTGGQDAYVMVLDSEGKVEWIHTVKGEGDARAKAVEVDNLGNIYLGGDFRGTNYIVSNGSTIELTKFGTRDAYLMSFTSSGVFRWQKTWGNTGVDFCKGIVTTSTNEVYAVGQFQKKVQFNDDSLTSTDGSKDLFVWKIDNTGATKWLRQIRSSEKLSGAEVAVDSQDNLVFGLGITGVTEFQTGASTFKDITNCGGVRCPTLVKYSSNGNTIDYLQANQSTNGRFGEIAISNSTVYIDCEIIGGSYTFNNDSFTTVNDTKDAALIAIKLN